MSEYTWEGATWNEAGELVIDIYAKPIIDKVENTQENEDDEEFNDDEDDMNVEYQWHSEGENSCDKCMELDGKKFKSFDDLPNKPHPNCDCTVCATSDGESVSFDPSEWVNEKLEQTAKEIEQKQAEQINKEKNIKDELRAKLADKKRLLQRLQVNNKINVSDIKQLKSGLQKLGYYKPEPRSEPDGKLHDIVNDNLIHAIKSFQRDNGLPETGTMNGLTMDKLGELSPVNTPQKLSEQNMTMKNVNISDDYLLQKAKAEITRNEDSVRYAYADTKGNVTIGKGILINNREEMKNINMVKDGRPATDEEKMAEYDRVKAQAEDFKRQNPSNDPNRPYNFVAKNYRQDDSLLLPQDEINRLTNDHMRKDLVAIRKRFPDFDTYSERRKLVIMDMQYNHGGFGKFPIFTSAVKNGFWEIAAKHSESGDISKERNKWRYDGLLDK